MTKDEIEAIAEVRAGKKHKKFRYTMNILIFLVMPILITWRLTVQVQNGIEGAYWGLSGDVFALAVIIGGLLAWKITKLHFATENEIENLTSLDSEKP